MIRRTRAEDRSAAQALLQAAGLPLQGVAEHFETFLVAERDAALVGVAGLELYGEHALLRSVVVAADARNAGLGSALMVRALSEARELGVREIYLLTTTATDFFAKRGFERMDRPLVAHAVTHSAEFTGACPDSAIAMRLRL